MLFINVVVLKYWLYSILTEIFINAVHIYSDMANFLQIWYKRHELLTNRPDWRKFLKGRIHLCFLIRIPLREKSYKELSEAVRTVNGLRMIPNDKLHITLKQAGFSKPNLKANDKEILRLISGARELLRKYRSFDIYICSVNIFSDVLFFEVKSRDLARIHKDLCNITIPKSPEREGKNYLPHIAFAELSTGIEKEIISLAEELRERKFEKKCIRQIDLVSISLCKGYPCIKTIARFELGH